MSGMEAFVEFAAGRGNAAAKDSRDPGNPSNSGGCRIASRRLIAGPAAFSLVRRVVEAVKLMFGDPWIGACNFAPTAEYSAHDHRDRNRAPGAGNRQCGAPVRGSGRRYPGPAGRIGEERGVGFDIGRYTNAEPAAMDPGLRRHLHRHADRLGLAWMDISSGAGHDCATFANQGVASAMIFIRNDHGSHNPDEAMEIDDFAQCCRLLDALLDELG